MARAEISEVVLASSGGAVAGASVQVNVRGGGAATVYVAETGGTTRANPLTTDSAGRIEGWLDTGSYNLVVSGAGISTYTQAYEAVSGSGTGSGVIIAWVTGTVYALGQAVTNGGNTYIAVDAHTAGATFSGDSAHWTALPPATKDKGVVFHAADATVTRPTGYASVEWIGSVTPTNAVDGDTWINTTT